MTVSEESAKGKALIAKEEHIGTRIDAFIASFMPSYVSRSRVTEIVKQGGVTVNGKEIRKPNHRLKLDDKIVMDIPEPEEATPEPENIPLDIYHEDDHLLIINKPAGMVVHPAPGHWSGTMVNALLHHCGDSLSGIGGVRRPGIVHRLDKDTSGLLVVAKNEETHSGLTAQFMDHGRTGPLERNYLALVWGRFEKLTGNLGLTPKLLQSITNVGYETPTPIQEQAIPLVMDGHDVMGLAQTGTGKTAAFGLPLVHKLMEEDIRPKPKGVRALILAPTRELVNQISENLRQYVKKTPIWVNVVIGGQSINKQAQALQRGTDILVATPGRLLDLADRKALFLDTATFLVLDEADQMLDLGFIHSLRKISKMLGTPRQTMLFSATMPKAVEDLSKAFLNDPLWDACFQEGALIYTKEKGANMAQNLPTISSESGLSRYMQEIRKFPMLEPNEEYMLAKSYLEHDDRDAAHKLVTSHLRLVAKIAMGYRGYGLPIGEVVSEGNVGLMQAVKKFDPERGFRLATYAMWWIKASNSGICPALMAAEGESGEWQDWLQDESESAEQILVQQDELENRREMLADAMSVLNEREQRIFMARRLEESPITLGSTFR
ncbi:RNA polymerase sigma factor RpoH [Nymphon striatum]|nr:RNA polymerase sigma factor RpoH [Nymphon striatum]